MPFAKPRWNDIPLTGSSKVTNPKPRDRFVCLSIITTESVTAPYFAKCALKSSLDTVRMWENPFAIPTSHLQT